MSTQRFWYDTEEWPVDTSNQLKQMMPLELFEMFFDNTIIELIVTE